jgi:hypothetical protein
MATWKELGVVPDSDDDTDYERQELSPPDHPSKDHGLPEDHGSIWEVPHSSQMGDVSGEHFHNGTDMVRNEQQNNESLMSSPLSSIPDDVEEPEYLNLRESTAKALPLTQGRVESPDPLTGPDDISRSYVRITVDIPQFIDLDEPTTMPIKPSVVRSSRDIPEQLEMDLDIAEDEEQASRRAAIRYERSLRPRKPIQEHPYLLENAQYTSVLKSHGVKPIRIATASETPRRRLAEEESQEQEFENESQESVENRREDDSYQGGLGESYEAGHQVQNFTMSSSSPMGGRSPHQVREPSSQQSTAETENTSLPGDDELPSLAELVRQQVTSRRAPKRKSSPGQSPKRKRNKRNIVDSDIAVPAKFIPVDVYDLSSSPTPNPSKEPADDVPTAVGNEQRQYHDWEIGSVLSILSDEPSLLPKQQRRKRRSATPPPPLVQIDDDESSAERPTENQSSSDSESGSEIVRHAGRRLRGVLPASWLRLDQQVNRQKERQSLTDRRSDHSPDKSQRRGVARPRIADPNSSTTPAFFFEDSGDEELSQQISPDDLPQVFKRPMALPAEFPQGDLFDDNDSVIEDNSIDPMMPSKSRQTYKPQHTLTHKIKRRKKPLGTNVADQFANRQRQPRITTHFDRSGNVARSRSDKQQKQSRSKKKHTRKPASAQQPIRAPLLSILDVIQPDAPQFLRIAARAAKRKRNLGKSSPSKKIINFGMRSDNIDAMSVLVDWRRGNIQPRVKIDSSTHHPAFSKRTALRQISTNIQPSRGSMGCKAGSTGIRTLTRHVSANGSVRYRSRDPLDLDANGQNLTGQPFTRVSSTTVAMSARPAQLEMDAAEHSGQVGFHAKKHALDVVFRRLGKVTTVRSNVRRGIYLRESPILDNSNPDPAPRVNDEAIDSPPPLFTQKSRRIRKVNKPTWVDINAAQYVHANDPLPLEIAAASVEEVGARGKLRGLGEFGTQYTQHFEVFPLDSGTFFHESTLIGQGCLEIAAEGKFLESLKQTRPQTSFSFGDRTLLWGPWDDQVSSELGILMDWILEELNEPVIEIDLPSNPAANSAITSILNYLQKSLSFSGQTDHKPFILRIIEIFEQFCERVESLTLSESRRYSEKVQIVGVLDRTLVSILTVLQICHHSPSLLSESFVVEQLLQKVAKASVRLLLDIGLEDVTKLYNSLNSVFRERGIRCDQSITQSWVIVIRVLDIARIPRTTFWEILYSVMGTAKVIDTLDVTEYEIMWRNLFTLLPLSEFDNLGIVHSGRRHRIPIDGWLFPQQMLRHVFQLYTENSQQSPSFNNYCRTLVSRCHYLVEQWGWRKCSGIIGVIFDFFGSQDLRHLRNEESYSSPHFLEELGGNPSLGVEPQDRCFHIFLKLLALVITRLAQYGLVNDIRNLVARTIPNHNRQYLKEQGIRHHDLAALRNHHDLLCTLFWAAPRDLRPPPQLIQQLVMPASSHKEACLINLRAWNQIARFIASSPEDHNLLPTLATWQNDVFQQLVQQFDSIASDMQQQFLALSKDASTNISSAMLESIISMNKRAVVDVLHFSVKASLDVMKFSQSLDSSLFSLNPCTYSLNDK